jgi:hypothetical protein
MKIKTTIIERREKLEEIVKDSTETVKHLFFFYLAWLISVLVLVLSTTDKMLLLSNEGLKLPIVDLNVPLIGFYIVIPLFVFAIHIHLLINLESHQNKLLKWQQAWDGSVAREKIHLLLFNLSVLEKQSSLKLWVNLASNIFYIYLGTLTLAIIFWRFADYQSAYISMWHLFWLLLDIYFVIKIKQTFAKNSPTNNEPKSKWYSKAMWLLIALIMTTKIMAVSWIDFTEDNTFAKQSKILDTNYKKLVSRSLCFITSRLNADFLGCYDITDFVFWKIIPYISIPIGENLLPPDSNRSVLEQSILSKEDPVLYHFNRRDIRIHLLGRSLRMAFFGSAVMPNTDFSKTRLQDATFILAHLENSNLSDAGLQNANLYSTNFQGADMRSSKLQNANLYAAQLQDAKLESASLEGADMRYSQMQNSDPAETKLKDVHWNGANIFGAKIGEADLKQALSQGAVLKVEN